MGGNPWFMVWVLVTAASVLLSRSVYASLATMWRSTPDKDERLGLVLIGFGHIIATSLMVFLGYVLGAGHA